MVSLALLHTKRIHLNKIQGNRLSRQCGGDDSSAGAELRASLGQSERHTCITADKSLVTQVEPSFACTHGRLLTVPDRTMNWTCKKLETVPWRIVLAQRQRKLLALHRPHRSARLEWPSRKHDLMLGYILPSTLAIPPTEADLSRLRPHGVQPIGRQSGQQAMQV